MKKLTIVMTLLMAVLFIAPTAVFAATTKQTTYSITANVDSTLTLNIDLYKGVEGTGPTGSPLGGTTIAFGTLKEFTYTSGGTTYKSLRSNDAGGMGEVIAMVSANSHQLPYTISQIGSELTSGSNKIPSGACMVVPVYSAADNKVGGVGQNMPTGAVLGSAAPWFGTRTIYQSETGLAQMRQIQAHYSITDDPNVGATQAVPLNQAGGSYTGTIVFQVVA